MEYGPSDEYLFLPSLMGPAKAPTPVKLFVALLCNHETLFPSVEADLTAHFGCIDSASRIFPWGVTEYYSKEMGSKLFRRFVSFSPLTAPERLPESKIKAGDLEEKYQWTGDRGKGRRVNIDPGYLEFGKVVLASTKNASHRIYLRTGIYGEVTLMFYNGSFHPVATTYPDYGWPETISFFSTLRTVYQKQLKQNESQGN
jgi:hypothetical protein